ncbi:Asp23/Gls24 family envelope stress response protein [Actinophytocola sp. NPDC049390]|uniref:Asp23/Gls24 family envelope stress response protein n=1 Tax=Actinophytocola sp. NPDC049390 TaxID=3363894 RepID=UPI0037B13437
MSDLMNSVYGHTGHEPAGTGTIDGEPTDALTQEPTDVESVDDTADDHVEDIESGDVQDAPGDIASPEARPEAGTRGNTTVSDAVVAKVVTMVAGEVDGVHRLDDEDSEVAVDGRVAMIRISLVVEYGQAVTALAKRIRADVVDAVEQGLGLDVASVDIHVGDIHVDDGHAEEAV